MATISYPQTTYMGGLMTNVTESFMVYRSDHDGTFIWLIGTIEGEVDQVGDFSALATSAKVWAENQPEVEGVDLLERMVRLLERCAA